MRRIAFFGGSFDPPHRGHLAIATAAADLFTLDQVLFAPAGLQPFKGKYPATDFLHRYTMTALAVQADPRFIPSLLDAPHPDAADATRPNYTVETLDHLRASLAAGSEPTQLFTLLGADSWLDIGHWHQASRLLAFSDWIVAARPGFSLARAEAVLPPEIKVERGSKDITNANHASGDFPACDLTLHHTDATPTRVWFLPDLQEDISATELRGALDQGHPDQELLPVPVWNYIAKTKIYRLRLTPSATDR
ncbi:MAG TPA: nicotinate (nicotinamide) nucleotide adenylyltransferase [Acidobacteriaceae bacterium]|nr:nicotinate (nicotinamide) nucleotide adenylyltransferase [Acidobacteriaceae bacterium]